MSHNTTFIPVLAVGGSDNSGGAGIQMDNKTLFACGTYPMNVITAITVQTQSKTKDVYFPSKEIVRRQLETSLAENPPLVVKIGMLGNGEITQTVLETLKGHTKIILDPVIKSSSGHFLLDEDGQDRIKSFLPNLFCITPNIKEAEFFTGDTISSKEDMIKAAKKMYGWGIPHVIIKGGHLPGEKVVDILWNEEELFEISSPRQKKPGLHGTGCCFASALSGHLAGDFPIRESFAYAVRFTRQAIESAFYVNSGYILNPMPIDPLIY